MHKTLYGQSQSVYAAAPVFEGNVGMHKRVVRAGLTAIVGVAVVGALSCNVIPEREPYVKAVCVNNCLDDKDPAPVDCAAAEEGVEFYPLPILDFDEGLASNVYSYSDGSLDFLRSVTGRGEDGKLTYDESQPDEKLGFEPSVRRNLARCIGEDPATSRVFHIQGGPFRAWGGAVGRHLKCLNSEGGDVYPPEFFTLAYPAGDTPDALNKGCGNTTVFACGNADPLIASMCPRRDVEGIPPGEEFMKGMTLDVTQWEGISFWARRSNDSQPGIRLALGDKHTDDDLSYLQYHINPNDKRFCERNQECGCPGGKECINGGCYDPRYDIIPDESEFFTRTSFVDGTEMTYINEDNTIGYSPCGQYMCERGFLAFRGSGGGDPREDVAFAGSMCQEFTFRGGITENFCYGADGANPPFEQSHLCGDHWLKSVRLSTEWQFFKVPFTELLQQGWAKEAYSLDLTSAAVLRFIWGRGWVDMMFDDVRFYRNKNTKE